MKFDYKYALINSSVLIPFAIFFGTASCISSATLLACYAITLAILYCIYYVKLEVPLKKKHPSLYESNRTTPTTITNLIVFLTVLLVIFFIGVNSSGAWIFPSILLIRWVRDGFSKPLEN
ncbi:hypothetical protein [Levilactobacillus brevis]|uniref:hypothetical protein n=1 Tax=Levilactobacillus brevis TaxID=1580 RepID=UPI003D180CC0